MLNAFTDAPAKDFTTPVTSNRSNIRQNFGIGRDLHPGAEHFVSRIMEKRQYSEVIFEKIMSQLRE